MKCPLIKIVEQVAGATLEVAAADCLSDKCAWYHKSMGRCILATLEVDLWNINQNLGIIADKLPPRRTI